MPRKRAEFSHIARSLLTLLKAEREGKTLSVTEFLRETGMSPTTFYTTIRDALTSYGFAEVIANPRERVVTIKLTEKGKKLATCFEELGLAKDLGLEELEEEEQK
jgi:DNA-binding MarR family transcriptional regulator